jgi:pyruvate/2-oxoglutarate dehydrogenase complex dihydrolipoamide acyltransferase (E2) component
MLYDLVVPGTADGAHVVTISTWHKTVGEPVKAGEDVVEANTEKITLYVVAPADGVLEEILVPEGEEASVGDVLGRVQGD